MWDAVRDNKKYEHVYLVYENDCNPVIPILKSILSRRSIDFSIVSGTLRADVEFLLRAKVLVGGRGTFLPGVVTLSENIEKIYHFDSGYHDWGRLGLQNIRITDQIGDYRETILKNWQNTEEQIKLMLTYPEGALSF